MIIRLYELIFYKYLNIIDCVIHQFVRHFVFNFQVMYDKFILNAFIEC